MSWDCTHGYDFFLGGCAAFDIRVTANLKKENFGCIVLAGKETTKSSRTQTVLEMFEINSYFHK
jgi:hypothetical protein